MLKNILKVIILSLVILPALVVITSHSKASAASYCSVLAKATTPNNCAAGQDLTSCTIMQNTNDTTYFGAWPKCGNGATQVELKQTFIDNMTTYINSGQYFQKTGANWILSGLGATSISDLTNKINLSTVTLGIDCMSFTQNSGYNTSTSTDVRYADTESGPSGCNGGNYTTQYLTYALVIYSNGVETYAILLNSGNPIGTLNKLPSASNQPGYNLESNVFTVNADGSNQQYVPGIVFQQPCGGLTSQIKGSLLTSSQMVSPAPYNANYYYSTIPTGDAYCLRIQSTGYNSNDAYVPGYDGPFTRPWDYGHGSQDNYPSVIGNGVSSTIACAGPFSSTNVQEHCPTYSYECQVAQSYPSKDGCGTTNLDNAVDAGLDFDYTAFTSNCSGIQYCRVNMPTCSLSGPANEPPSTPFNINYSITNNALIAGLDFSPTGPYTLTVSTSPSVATGFSTPPFTVGNTSSSTSVYTNYISMPALSSGSYTVTMSINVKNLSGNGYSTLVNCPPYTVQTASSSPYLKVFGGDVLAGVDSKYINSCYDTTSGISSWNQGGNGVNNAGAGTSVAALATGSVNNFTSGQNLLSMLKPRLDSLTFSNEPTTTFGTSTCGSSSSYFQQAQNNTSSTIRTGISGNWCPSPSTIPLGSHYIYLAAPNANVTITCNIQYSFAGYTATTPPSQIPSIELITSGGNINIQTPFPSNSGVVTRLDGIYIAEANSSNAGGTINDTNGTVDICSGADNAQNTCANDRLLINGAFIANKVYLYRTYGTLSSAGTSATPQDTYDAEEFDYSPVNWLVPSSTNQLQVQSITSLPPIL